MRWWTVKDYTFRAFYFACLNRSCIEKIWNDGEKMDNVRGRTRMVASQKYTASGNSLVVNGSVLYTVVTARDNSFQDGD